MSSALYPNISERTILFLVGAVQFINILDFMMVMPLGPDFAPVLGIKNADLGWVGGSYTAAAAFAGIIGSLFVDKYDRKRALLMALSGLMIATALGGCAWDFRSLLVCRIMAGLCGGPATSIAWSIVADVVEPARRGQAMGKVMGAFSVAAIFGVPFGLEMARLHNWSTPFFVTALMGTVIIALALRLMPSMKAHIGSQPQVRSLRHLFALMKRPLYALTYLYIFIAMLASFMIVPNISAYVQYNLHYPRASLGWLYSAGGIVSFITMRITGRMIDRFSASATSFASAFTYVAVLFAVFITPLPGLPVVAFFMLFMLAMGMRNVSSTTLATTLPTPQERAGFMSLLSAVQGTGMASGAFFATHLLAEHPDHSLDGMATIASISASISFLVPLLMRLVERLRVKAQ